MPTALETLVKILKLEREQGCKNNAVIGGLAAYVNNWTPEARKQARLPEQRALVEELIVLLGRYEQVESRTERHGSVTYMLDRITGRIPAPPEYLTAAQAQVQSQPETPAIDAPKQNRNPKQAQREPRPDNRQERRQPQREESQQQEQKPQREQQPREPRKDQRQKAQQPETQTRQQEQPRHQPRPQKQPQRPPHPSSTKSIDGDDEGEAEAETMSGGGEIVYDTSDSIEATYTGQLDIPPEPRLARAPRKSRKPLSPEEAADILRGLEASVTQIKGIGPRVSKLLNKLDIETINDMLFFLPRRYDDYTRLTQINRLPIGVTVTVIGTIRRTEIHIGRNNRKDFYMEVDDGSGVMSVLFFGQQFLVRQIRAGQQLVISGTTTVFNGRIQMINPEWETLESEHLHTVGIVPIYPLTEGLSPRLLRRAMRDTVEYWSERLPDYVPEATLDRAELGDLGWAIKNLHFPEGHDHLEHARNRFVFDQLLLMQLAILANRRDWQAVPAQPLNVTDEFMESFIQSVFPYPLTGAQRRSIDDIRRDVSLSIPMNRLLQGDVGAGKTAVALATLAMAFSNGKQAALMAPTSILAEQHYRGISRTLENMPGDRKPVVGLLTGSLTASERQSIYNGLADGSIDMIVGTHALIQEGVQFHDLAIAVIDEQHRFGVEQRGHLRGKGTNPHVLVMTATPIPRTLALTMYADLDLSIMDEMPPGRIPIRTRIVHPVERERLYNFVESQIKEGRQAFFIHPLVESSDKVEAKAAIEEYEYLQGKVFRKYKLALLHGRMKPAEKDEIMAAFSRGDFDILVTTSVAEVGVDVPNASVIVIEGANRFGLAQLHQFRGRVGRGQHASYCLLIPDTATPEAMERLQALEATTDGFKLAEIDWKLRGPGDLVGTRQSGRTGLKLMENMTPHLVEMAQREARTIYEEDPYLQQSQHQLLKQRVEMIYRRESDLT